MASSRTKTVSNVSSFIFCFLAGGLNAVIWTDTIQTLILIIGSFILAGISKQLLILAIFVISIT